MIHWFNHVTYRLFVHSGMSADAAADAGEGSSKATLDLPARGDGAAGGAEGASPPRDASEIVPFEVEQKGEEVTLARTLSFWDGSAIVVGLIIGSGKRRSLLRFYRQCFPPY